MSKMKELNRLIHDMEETAKYYLRLVDEFKKLLSNDDETVPKPISPKNSDYISQKNALHRTAFLYMI